MTIPEGVAEVAAEEASEREEEILLSTLSRLAADQTLTPAELERLGAWLDEANGDRGGWGTKDDIRVFHDTIAKAWARIEALSGLLLRAAILIKNEWDGTSPDSEGNKWLSDAGLGDETRDVLEEHT